jgi:uncharacterized protein (DUF2384 family)
MGQPLTRRKGNPRLTELCGYATEIFGDPAAAMTWLDTPLWELGLVAARDVLLRIEYGVYS